MHKQQQKHDMRRDLIFRVFVSSTFEDMKAEREALQREVWPVLREYCQQRGARFQAVDLRWGVSLESAFDQKTMSICLAELERCQRLSPRPNFVVLLGQRYGWVPLPVEIEAGEFELLCDAVIDEGDLALLAEWYRLDENAVPAEYVLLPREGGNRNEDTWWRIEGEIRRVLQGTAADVLPEDDSRRAGYFRSATHQEIDHGALHCAPDTEEHVLAFFRDAHGVPDEYVDTDPELVETLRRQVKDRIGKGRCSPYTTTWAPNGSVDCGTLCEDVRKGLEVIIDAELKRFRTQSALHRERDAHQQFGLDRCRHFKGRQDVLTRIAEYLRSEDRSPLVIHGPSGFGKTALMAEAWRRRPEDEAAIVRFIGATPDSADLRTLLRGLCEDLGLDEIPEEMNDLTQAFQNRLSGQDDADVPGTMLFLDALDQINDTGSARWLYWLPNELAPGVKVVLSVLDDQEEDGDCFDIASRKWKNSLVPLGPMGRDDGETVLQAWLSDASRTLQAEQRNAILDRFAHDGSPLFLKLAFEQARRWRSWDPNTHIATDVQGLLSDLFARLEQKHGKPLVCAALMYLAVAKNGLTEEELMDNLSRDNDVLLDFLANSPTEQRKAEKERLDALPLIVWSRLYADVERYMTQRRADGTVLMDFYHRQVTAAVRDRYLHDTDTRQAAHQHLADYFASLDYWAESLEAQQARAKRLPPTPRPANVRKVVELPYHVLEVAKLVDPKSEKPEAPEWDAVADLLTDWQFLEAKTEADPNGKYLVEHQTVEIRSEEQK